MSDNLTRAPLQVFDLDISQINDALRQIQNQLDEMQGLRGRALVWDRMQVSDPTVSLDALNLGSAGLGTFVTTGTAQTITATKTFTANQTWDTKAIRVIDGNGQLIHSFGTIT